MKEEQDLVKLSKEEFRERFIADQEFRRTKRILEFRERKAEEDGAKMAKMQTESDFFYFAKRHRTSKMSHRSYKVLGRYAGEK